MAFENKIKSKISIRSSNSSFERVWYAAQNENASAMASFICIYDVWLIAGDEAKYRSLSKSFVANM